MSIPDIPGNPEECLDLEGPLNIFMCLQREGASGLLGNNTFCASGAFPFPLTNTPECALGFFCPNIDPLDESTWPQVCPPTVECQFARLGNTWCPPQGRYEPQLCEPGFFCPTPFLMLPCPEGTWCTRGTVRPRPCGPMTLCPRGTQIGTFYGGVLLAAIIDALLLVGFLWYRYVGEPAARVKSTAIRRTMLVEAAQTAAGGAPLPRTPAFAPSAWAAMRADAAAALAAFTASLTPKAVVPGVVTDFGGRVRTKSMRRASGSGPLYAGLTEDGADSQVSGVSGLQKEPKRGDRVASMSGQGKPLSVSASFARLVQNGAPWGLARSPSANALDEMTSAQTALDRAVTSAATVLLKDGFRRCNAGLRLDLAFSGLGLTLPAPVYKTILSDVSGRISSGRVTAIMGPSGAGKTTFLSVLMGRVARTAGELRINGQVDEMAAYRRITGFVPQDDVMLMELTVRENIMHAARVRLPRHGWPDAAVQRHVDAVVEVLGLSGCANTPASRISGGQRKRTNIGMELAVAPAAIFLDEPTSGLDATAALEVCRTLRTIADLGLTVVAVIHQPRAEIFASFDDLLLLAPGGHTVYMGPQAAAVPYFSAAGFTFSHGGANPADDMLDFVAGRETIRLPQATLDAMDSPKSVASVAPSFDSSSEGRVMLNPIHQLAVVEEMRDAAAFMPVPTADAVAFPAADLLPSEWQVGEEREAGAFPWVAEAPYVELRGREVARYLAALWRSRAGKAEEVFEDAAVDGAPPAPVSVHVTVTPSAGEGSVTWSAVGRAAWRDVRWLFRGGRAARRGRDAPMLDPGAAPPAAPPARSGAWELLGAMMAGSMTGSQRPNCVRMPLQAIMDDRGATRARQLALCHARSLLQQYRQASWLVLELVVCIMAGSIMGLAATAVDELYSGILVPPYTMLSPSPMETMLPSLGFYVNMAIGIAGSPAAVRMFGEERDMILREAAGGHDALAYFSAKNIAVLYRMVLSALHFAGFFVLLARPTASFGHFFTLTLFIFFGVYGLSMLMSMFVSRANAALLGVIACLVFSCLCGFGPNLIQGREWGLVGVLQDISYARWGNEYWMHMETQPYRELFLVEVVSAGAFGYTLNRPVVDVVMMIVIGIGMRIAAFGGLLLLLPGFAAALKASVEAALRSGVRAMVKRGSRELCKTTA
jgi:ABC-type multidrug transport system ATPase subunit